jgi:hypothetical protein
MSLPLEIDELIETIRHTESEIDRTRQRALEARTDFASRINLRSLEKRLSVLEGQFQEAADRARVQVCRYRLFDEQDNPPNVRAFANALTTFQNAFSVFFGSLQLGPRERGRIAEAVSESSSFQIAYAFSGSLGVVLTLPNEVSTQHTTADEAIAILIRSVDATESASFREVATEYGIAAVRALSKWYKALRESQLGVDVDWRGDKFPRRVVLQPAEVKHRYEVIAMTGAERVYEESLGGTLVALDLERRTFALEAPEGHTIRGNLAESIQREFTLPGIYTVHIRVTETIRFASDDSQRVYELLEVQEVS